MKKRRSVFLGVLQLFTALGAIPAGLSMVLQPDGVALGMSTEILTESPFQDFFIPGLLLLFVIGFLHAIAAFLSFGRHQYAGVFGVVMGAILIGWISIQIYFIGLVHVLQPLFLLIGAVEAVLGFLVIAQRKSGNKG